MNKNVGLLIFLTLATIASGNTIELGKSVIKNKNYKREYIRPPKMSKNTYTVTETQIHEKNYKNVEDILRDSPGVVVQNTAFGPRVDMRGSGEKSLSRVKIMVDGISINPTEETMASLPINSIPIESISKIEIIPGGGATLYGSGSVGGVINIETNSNVTKNNFFMDMKYGSYDNRNFGFAGGQNITDNLYVNYGFNYINSEGYREAEDKENTVFLGGFDYKINDRNKIRFQGRRGKENLNGTTEVSKEVLAHNRRAPGLNMDLDTKNESYALDYEYRNNENITFGITGFKQKQKRNIETESIDDIDITLSNRKFTSQKETYHFQDVKSQMEARFTEDKKGVKIKTNYKYAYGDIFFGYDYYKAVNKRKSYVKSETLKTYNDGISNVNLSAENRVPVINRVDINLAKESHALYMFNKLNIGDNWDMTAGIRGEMTKYSGYRHNGPNTMPFLDPKIQHIETDEKLKNYAGEIGGLYRYRDTGAGFLRYEHGFVTPFATQLTDKIHDTKLRNPNGMFIPPIVNVASIYVANGLKSEITDTVELGIRDYFFDFTTLSASVFVTDTKDEITLVQSGVTNPAVKRWKYRNIGKTRRMGLELEAEQQVTDRLSLSQSATFLNAKVIKGDHKFNINKDDKIPMVPSMKLTLGAKYIFTDHLSFLGNYTYEGKKEARELDDDDKVSRFDIKAHGVIDVGMVYKIDDYASLKAGIKNLASTKYNLRETSKEAYPAPERNYYMELNVKF
ncbi:TonB-dependent receptor [Fusobacterium sp.]|uniref:TonB-dependent receptor n=1 Tax=Fusobacterium sp. TaxID=68766 RepID=UPI00396C7F9C